MRTKHLFFPANVWLPFGVVCYVIATWILVLPSHGRETANEGRPSDQAIASAAADTYVQYVRDGAKSGASRVTEEVPKKYWQPALVQLKPLRVYVHRVNVVVVQKESKGEESGIYVCIALSSYIPTDYDDQFTFSRHLGGSRSFEPGTGVLYYRRAKGAPRGEGVGGE